MFAIWMHFKWEYWIIENMCLKIWYMPLKPAIDIHNIWMFPFAKATNWVDTTYLHVHTYFYNPKKKRVWIVDPWHVQQVEPQTLIMEKIIMEKNRSICPSPLISQEKSIMEIMATSKNYGKKRFGSLPGYFEPLWGKIQLWKNRTQAPPV